MKSAPRPPARRRPEPTPVLDIVDLTVQRGSTVILRDLSWRIRPGEHWVILGPNGCGKTSLLSALTGYLMPTSGDIHLLGETFGETDWRALRTRIGIVSSALRQMMGDTEPALDTVASGRYAMIDFWGRPNRRDRVQALALLRQVELPHLANRPWAVLSQGERQRVLIARALMADPRLLILDEPCVGLDPIARERFLQFVERLSRRRNAPALVLVTHHVEEITPAFTHVLVLRDGRSVDSGPVEQLLDSRRLSEAFGTRVAVHREGRGASRRFHLRVREASRRIA